MHLTALPPAHPQLPIKSVFIVHILHYFDNPFPVLPLSPFFLNLLSCLLAMLSVFIKINFIFRSSFSAKELTATSIFSKRRELDQLVLALGFWTVSVSLIRGRVLAVKKITTPKLTIIKIWRMKLYIILLYLVTTKSLYLDILPHPGDGIFD